MEPDSKNDDAVISSFEGGNRVATGYYTRGEWDLMQEIMLIRLSPTGTKC